MHEASLAQSLLQVVCESVENYNQAHPEKAASKVTSITVGLGLLSCIEPVTFTGCFELLAENTIAQGATLKVQIQPLPCSCPDCNKKFSLNKRHFVCPYCGSERLSCSGGHGMDLLGIEVQKKD